MNHTAVSPSIAGRVRVHEDEVLLKREQRKILLLVVAAGFTLGTVAAGVSNMIPGEAIELHGEHIAASQAAFPAALHVESVSAPIAAAPLHTAAVVQQIWTDQSAGHTRVRIEGAALVRYEAHELQNPRRIFVDFDRCRIGEDLPTRIVMSQPALKAIRVAQYTSETARVVLDLENEVAYSVSPTATGVVIDLSKN